MQSLKNTALALAVIAAAILYGHFGWHSVTPRQYYPVLDTIVRYDIRHDTLLRVDTLRQESILTRVDTFRVLMARADSLPPDSAVPLLRRACFTLDTALTTCESRVNFWRADADTVRSQRDTLAAILRRQPKPRHWDIGPFVGYGVKGMDAGIAFVLHL